MRVRTRGCGRAGTDAPSPRVHHSVRRYRAGRGEMRTAGHNPENWFRKDAARPAREYVQARQVAARPNHQGRGPEGAQESVVTDDAMAHEVRAVLVHVASDRGTLLNAIPTDATVFLDLGFDSIQVVEITAELESRLGVELPMQRWLDEQSCVETSAFTV